MADMIMPQMGESIVEGTVVKWRKKVGELVKKDEMLLEISTDKVDSEIPSPASGVLQEILVEEGKTVAVGTVLARITAKGEKTVSSAAPADRGEIAIASQQSVIDSNRERARVFLSPVVKKMAQENNISLSELVNVAGSGANRRISKKDLETYLATRKNPAVSFVSKSIPPDRSDSPAMVTSSDGQVDIIPMDHIRKRIAAHMVMSKHTAPHVTSVAEVDMTRIVKYRERIKTEFEKREGVSLSYTAFFVFAAAQALRDFPLVNSSVDGDRILQKKNIHIGVAVGMENGLIVPVIRNADRLSLVGLAQTVTDLAQRARNKQLSPDDVQGGTFSITNIGTFGNLFGTPIINQPQVAILGTGAIKKRPMVIEDDAIAIRSMMYISLTYDHRIIDGLYGGSFLQRIVQNLENFKLEV